MKLFYHLFILLLFFLWGCSGSIDTANLSAEEKLANAIKLYEDEDYEEAVNEFQAILLQYPGNEVIDDAQYYLAKCRFARGEYILAAYEFSKLIKTMPASPFLSESQFMLGESYFELSPNYSLDQRYTKKAIEEYQAFIDFFPLDKKVAEAEQKIHDLNEKLAEKEFNSARIYEKMEYSNAAIFYYNQVLEKFHDSKFAPLASYRKILLLISKGKNTEALKEINNFLVKYPMDINYPEVENLRVTLESNLSASK
ncbi:MAG: outer membrane protein assembly factor BamD [Ignavibacteriaceae bacterium]|nr:outer membrane protein assembly factor BamD [Ignavibacteriaceae bacterium]